MMPMLFEVNISLPIAVTANLSRARFFVKARTRTSKASATACKKGDPELAGTQESDLP